MKQQSITGGLATDAPGNQTLYGYLLSSISAIGGGVATWVQNLPPLNGDYANNVIFEEWQFSPYFGGAFKLSEPGQDQYTQKMGRRRERHRRLSRRRLHRPDFRLGRRRGRGPPRAAQESRVTER